MITKKLLLVLVVLCCMLGSLSAKVVTEQTAIDYATKFLENRGVQNLSNPVVKSINNGTNPVYYIINFQPKGWVILSADDTALPLIGFSDEGTFLTDDMPETCTQWLQMRYNEINDNYGKGNRKAQWDSPVAGSTRASDDVEPLLQVNWNQGKPYYQFCPSNENGTSVVGCVAVAMAQAMSVVKYPERPVGEYSYNHSVYGTIFINYDEEAAYDWSKIISGADSRVWVAHLLYHCGVSLKMNYSPTGSGTQTAYIPAALQRNFSYPSSVKFYTRSGYSGDWSNLILTELQEGRVVCYSGIDSKQGYGHCFNLDGYSSGMFHVNWGWGGSNNGYFALDGLKDLTMNMDYTDSQGVVVGIRAPSDAPMNITLSSTSVAEQQPSGTYVADVQVESEAINPTYDYALTGKYSLVTHSYKSTPFTITENKLYTTKTLSLADGEQTVRITATNKKNSKSITREFAITITDAAAVVQLEKELPVSFDEVNHCLYINSESTACYFIYSQNGLLIKKGNDNTIETGDMPTGWYILKMNIDNKQIIQKILIH